MAPVAGPSTQMRPTQALPQATHALLHTLAPVHSTHFPRLARAVHADTSDFATSQQRQDAEQKIALLKSVLGGWLHGVEADLEAEKDASETTENLAALIETLPGSLSGLRAKPRLLLHSLRNTDDSTARLRSPTKTPSALQAEATEVTDADEDLATFLVPRCLSTCTRLQAALLNPPTSANVPAGVIALRRAALAEVETFLMGILDVLAESGLRIEWHNKDVKAKAHRNGVGKAKQVVQALLQAVRVLFPDIGADSPDAFPRVVRLFDDSAAADFLPHTSEPMEPPPALSAGISIRSSREALSCVVSSLRVLTAVTTANEYLEEYRGSVLELVVEAWPSPDSFALRSETASHKGKGIETGRTGLAESREQLVLSWISMAHTVFDSPDAGGRFELQVVAAAILREVHTRLSRDPFDADAESSTTDAVPPEIEVLLVSSLARIWALGRAGGTLQNELQEFLRRSVDYANDVSKSGPIAHGRPRPLADFVARLSDIAERTTADSAAGTPSDDYDDALVSLILKVSAELTEAQGLSPLARQAVTSAAAAVKSIRLHPSRPKRRSNVYTRGTSPRKRIRTGDDDSDIVFADSAELSSAEQARVRRERVRKSITGVLSWCRKSAEEDVGSGAASMLAAGGEESAEQTMLRYISALPSASPELATHLARATGLIGCARSDCIDSELALDPAAPSPSCQACDSAQGVSPQLPVDLTRSLSKEPLDAFVRVFPDYFVALKTDAERLVVLDAFRRLIRHSAHDHPATQSPTLRIIKPILEHPNRSLRCAAGEVFLAIASARQDGAVGDVLAKDLFAILDGLLAQSKPLLSQTVLQLAGKIAKTAEPQGLLECESLARILRKLGDRNLFIKQLAKQELIQAATHRGVKPYALVSPHFAVLSSLLVSTPLVLNTALDVLHQSRESLLRVTREHILPDIILRRDDKLLQEVVKASRAESVAEMLCDPPVAAAVLAHLFVQPETTRGPALKYFTTSCRGVVLRKLIESVHVPLVYHLVLALGDEEPAVAAQASSALVMVERYRLGHSADVKIDIAETLKQLIVGLLSHMNRGLHEANHQRPLRDKQRIIRSLDGITRMVGRAISGFSPQIMATLQTALEIPGLRLVALRAFLSFIQSLKFADIGAFIGPTTAAFVKLWPELGPLEREAAVATINYIVVENADNLSAYVKDVADLADIPELSLANRRLQAVRRTWTFATQLDNLLDRVGSENEVVMLQGLHEMRAFLNSNAAQLYVLASGDTFDPSLGRLVAILLGAAVREGVENELHRNIAFECIGIVGAVDPDRFELPPVEQPPVVVENFLDGTEAIHFAIRLIVDLLVGAYRSTNDTKHQELLAYALQELLQFCHFTSDVVTGHAQSTADELNRNRWLSLPKSVMEACAPLLTTRFSLQNSSLDAVTFPIYTNTSTYREWVRSFANELLKRVSSESSARSVFGPFAGLLHLEDTTVAQYLLPHLVLHVLISGKETDRDAIKTEIGTILQDQVSRTQDLSENSRLLSAQTVFALMDHLSRWITLAKKLLAEIKAQRKKTKKERQTNEREIHEGLLSVEGILQDVPHILVGEAALTCKAYARSLLNFESHINAERRKRGPGCDKDLQVYYENLHECYAHLDEPDGMEGISTRILDPTVQHQIREHESTGRWTSAQSCWEVRLQQKPDDPLNHVGLLRCLRNLGHYDSMRTHIAGLFASRGGEYDWERILAPFNIEASLFVGDWAGVENALEVPGADGPEAAFGRALCAIRTGNQAAIERSFYEARESLGNPIVAAGRESYRRVYDSVIHLHILDELKQIQRIQLVGPSEMPALTLSLASRLHASAPAFRAREPILNLRRTAFGLASLGDATTRSEVGGLWLETSKIARKAGHYQTAYSAILQARECEADFAFFQSAKLFKANDQTYKAIQELDNNISPLLAVYKVSEAQRAAQRSSPLAKAALCRVRWMLEAGRLETNEAALLFTEVEKLAPNWENAPYHLGHFWDSQADEKEKKRPRSKGKRHAVEIASYRSQTVKLYLAALTRGTKFIYQTLPRTLTIWLELGERPEVLEGIKKERSNTNDGESHDLTRAFKRCNRYVKESVVVRPIPSYLWLTVLPQVVSRILHGNNEVHDVLETILRHVLATYPHHGFWAMASGAKSTTNRRAKRNMRVFQKAKDDAAAAKRHDNVEVLIEEGLRLVDQLLVLCNFAINDKADTLSLKRTFPSLHKLTPTKVIIPLQNSLTVSLPFDASQAAAHKPFPDYLPTFQSFDDQILIMSSLQKPRKITVRGSDGRSYGFLCKPKDDLRKDARLMEFNSMIIKLLKKDSDARSRKLNIRTYSVVPLNEECGLIEWVPHVVVLRGVLNKRYASMNIASWSPELKRIFDTIRDDPKRTAERFETEVLKNFPSIFHEWFLENFPEPSAWHRARLAYSRTAAVISMVGFVLGLGDRHCENILLDGTTGDTVHVDFNCLFDKGRTFEVAERVPFRLTHNIIDGMGVTGVEGVFRRSAEISLRILRANKDSLRSVLETFLHDPLVEWVHSRSKRDSSNPPDQTKARALEALEPISNKLMGLQVTSDPESLGPKEVTIEEQVERLIREARNPHNLGSMYVGWCSWF